ncbi:hypothetical protein K6119_06875 [Paracrocinitomix mangrovi]|uniref:hypothetical protein n=1 Tax=Paracrocinitomix mangrovi TaxID=2862509 RepID=UPI001C8DC936|nr:hypothetical protein [Paracrocinitomix mangrovi]UKN03236.1 hypothetical protein K6119_06875 [Paracrocinitomix mangrovi]
MNKVTVLLAFVGAVSFANAQFQKNEYINKKVEKANQVEQIELSKEVLKRQQLTPQVRQIKEQELVDEMSRARSILDVYEVVQKNPKLKSNIMSNNELLYQFGIDKQAVKKLEKDINKE